MDFRATRPVTAAAADYARIERAIRFLMEDHTERPGLTRLSGVLELSEFHLQRVFHRWAGVTPKSFIQIRTLGRARRLLQESQSLLAASLDLGLSGPARLHDLFLRLEAMTPGEYKARAAGMVVAWGIHPTPFGEALFAATDRGLCGLSFVEEGGREAAVAEMHGRWPGARWRRDPDATRPFARALEARVEGRLPQPLSLLLKGTPFQVKVWEALLRIPEGAVLSYQGLARLAGIRGAARAAGGAVAANPIGWLIPCHRVIRSSGVIGDYRWGETRKRAMLVLELARRRPEGPGGARSVRDIPRAESFREDR